ncbi:ribosomal L7Ae/L30e/S12e/Gadd45 family protein [Thalassobacillus sp. CUG 92003]|uniref:L7Ae/L30e/S12e/Gadd45 family ribosomal protein n=1 Tax=Thalassobacillus sp. CUG 92003 TaxID=2736641 RepID=UPI0015E67A65|nr:ribosomal L7Ae/L30e/S12e/Gadd45 family protein [Thalassobacillus sp. CUG 92003]
MTSSYLSLIGLAFRAGKCSLGEDAILNDIKNKRAKLVVIANDTGFRTAKKLKDKCSFYAIPCYEVADRETLSASIGKTGRVAIAILDKGFATKLQSLLDE